MHLEESGLRENGWGFIQMNQGDMGRNNKDIEIYLCLFFFI